MGNCLVTKLKAEVNNNNLQPFGKLVVGFNITTASSKYFQINVSGDTEFKLSDPTKRFYSNGQENPSDTNVITTNSGIYKQLMDTGEYNLIISPKYNIAFWNTRDRRIASTIDLEIAFKYCPITYFACYEGSDGTTQFEGNIDAFKDKDMTVCKLTNQSGVYGSFDDVFGPMTRLNDFVFTDTQVSGDIVDFVKKQVKAGRASYTFENLKYLGAATGIKFNGQNIVNRPTNVLTWADNAQDNTKTDITLTTGNETPITVTVDKL